MLEEERKKFIESIVPYICDKGWSEEALKLASQNLFESDLYYNTLFDSVDDILEYFSDMQDEKMIKKFGVRKDGESIRQFIGKLVLFRIKEMPGGVSMHIALKDYYMKMNHFKNMPKSLWKSSDRIWRQAGDKSVDMNYYSKRFLLSSILGMSINKYIKNPEEIDVYVPNALDKLVKRMQKFKIPKIEDIPILRLFS